MTICVAARSHGIIFAASDRMLTIGDIAMESRTPKIWTATTSIAVLTSDDDSAFHHEILTDVFVVIRERIANEPENWWNVKDVVDLYISHRNAHKARRAERAILTPIGLTQEEYVKRNQELDPDLARQIASDLINYRVPYLAAIFVGFDLMEPISMLSIQMKRTI